MMISPGPALEQSRDAVFTASPMTVYSSRRSLPMLPANTSPKLIPMPMFTGWRPCAAHLLVQRAALLEDDLHHLREILGQQGADLVRVHLFRHGRESADVAEEDDHGPLLAAAQLDRSLLAGDLGGHVGREVALEIGHHHRFAADPVGQVAVLDGHGRNTGERDEELEVLVAERVGGGQVIPVDDAEDFALAADERSKQ